jgi:hypothetical protein
MKIMTLVRKEAPANFVPAAAVIRRGRALSGIIGRKESVDGICCCLLKTRFVTYYNAYNTLMLEFDWG